MGLLRAGDPHQDVWFAWNAKEVVRQIYDHVDVDLAGEWVDAISRDFADPEMPLEVRRLGRTIAKWRHQIVAWHHAHVSNGPTEAINNLVKRVKRSPSGSDASTTTASAPCSTPVDPTGACYPPSPHREIGRAGLGHKPTAVGQAQAGRIVRRMTVFFIPLERTNSKPACSYIVRVPL
ncbi:MAG: transposase [Haloechinothrix sp.]